MQGRFDLSLLDAYGLKDSDFEGLSAVELDHRLQSLPLVQKVELKNKLFDNAGAYFFPRLFSGPSITSPFEAGGTASSLLSSLLLMTTATDTTSYTEETNETGTPHNLTDSVNTSTGGKRFIADQVTTWGVFKDPNGREGLLFRNRFLYLPSQAISANIQSIGIYYSQTAQSTGSVNRGRLGRVKLKDSGGTPVTLNKTASQILLVEYTFGLVSF